ncbi:hypothetical protein AMK17_32155 [Streptomyces sp. CB00072]|nr:hypothetical protein AMK17_32155 [Streptomyces sp. CB00072]
MPSHPAEIPPSRSRARRDGPDSVQPYQRIARCSPHLQGWSPAGGVVRSGVGPIPAPAGMALQEV